MAHGTQVRGESGQPTDRAAEQRAAVGHRLRIWLFALLSLACAGSAWADSLALMTGAGQSGLGGSSSTQPLVVQVRNVDGVVVAGRTINWTTSNGFILSAASSVTDANGNASVNFTYGNYGTTYIVANDPVGATSMQAPENSTGSDSITLISGGGQTGQAGTAGSQPIVVQVLNAAGNAVVGRTVNWSDTTAYTHVSAATSTTNASGFASMTFTYFDGPPVAAGTPAGIVATNSIGGQSVTANVTEIGTNVLTITSGLQVTGLVGQTSPPIVAHVADWQGNPIAGATVTWSTPVTGIFNLSSTSTITDASGNASITAQYIGATGDDIITADHNGFSLDVHFYLQTQGHMERLSPNPIIGSPNTASSTPMAIQDFNKDGTPRVGDTITWSVQSGDAVPNAPTSVTDATGKATMGFTFGTLSSGFSATDSRGISRSLRVSPVVSGQSMLLVSGAGQTGASLSAAASPIVMKVVDQAGTPLSGVTITWSQYANGTFGFQGNVVFTSSTTSVSDASGLVQVSFNFGAPGPVAIVGLLPSGNGNTATVNSYGIETLTVLSGSGQSGLVGTHGAQPVVVVFRDQAGNPLASQTVTWAVTNGNAVLDATSSLTNASGQASIGFTYGAAASINSISASATSSNGYAGPISVEAFVTGVGANSLSLISGNGQIGMLGAPGALPFVVEVRDAAGSVVAGRTIFWSTTVPVGNAVANASSSITDASGRASMTFTYGSNSVTSVLVANDSISGEQVQFTVTALKPQNHAVIVSGNGQSGLPGTAGAQPIVVALLDASNVPQPGQNVAWRVVSGPAVLLTSTAVTDASGQTKATFNFGPTPGTSIIEGYNPSDPVNGQRIQATVISLGSNQALTIVSGDGQTLVGNTPSQPLVVQLKNISNAPVVGATISWTATNGNLPVATSVTDASGRASNTVTSSASGAVKVVATSTLASAPVTFNLSTGLATLTALTPQERAIAGAIDTACPALANKPNLTPAEADLLARCQDLGAAAGINGGATATALGQLVTETAAVQSNAAVTAVTAQFQNINLRLNALRSKSPTSSLSGLSFAGPGGVVPLTSLMGALLGEGDTHVGADFSRWGFFATGTIGRGSADPRSLTPGYNYDINGLTAGVDYRQRDNWVSGAAIGFSRQNTTVDNHGGHVTLTGWSLSSYSTWSFKNNLYLDGVLTWGSNSFDLERRIDYTLPLPGGGSTSIHQSATSSPGGDLFSGAMTFGGDFHKKDWNLSPYAQVIYSRMGFNAYREKLLSGAGSGLGLSVDSRTVTSLSSVLGAKVSVTNSTDWGVFIPTASFEWQHEYKSDLAAITARFINDPTQTSFTLAGTQLDNSYFRLGLGASFVLPHGRSGFVLFEHQLGRSGMHQDNLGVGIRIEF